MEDRQDEVERMRARKQRREQLRQERNRQKEIEIIDFDDLERARAHRTTLDDSLGRLNLQKNNRTAGQKRPGQERNTERYVRDQRYEAITRQVKEARAQKTESAVRQAAEERRKKRHKKKRRRTFFGLLLLCLLLGGIFFYFRGTTGSKYWTVAVFGVDSRDGGLEKDNHSDVEMVCVVNRETGEIRIVSVFRDTYMQVSGEGKYHKINQAYFDGGHKQAVEALERNLDLKIDDYATFNWKAVADAITILGGIDLEVSQSEFEYINGFITETVNSTGLGSYQLDHPGMQHLDGVQSVAYARLRLMDTDYNRTARQRLVISLAMEKAKQADIGTLTTVINTVLPQISTSVGINDLLPLAKSIKKFHMGESGGFPFSRGETYIGKKDCVIPLTLESNVIQLHQFLYDDMEYQPSSTVKEISARIAADSGMGEVAENAPEAKVGGSSGASGSDTSSSQEVQTQPPAQETPEETVQESLQESVSMEETSTEETESSPDGVEDGESSEENIVEPSEIGPGMGPGMEPGESSQPMEPSDPGDNHGPGDDIGPGEPGYQPESTEDFSQRPSDPTEYTEPIGPGNPGPTS